MKSFFAYIVIFIIALNSNIGYARAMSDYHKAASYAIAEKYKNFYDKCRADALQAIMGGDFIDNPAIGKYWRAIEAGPASGFEYALRGILAVQNREHLEAVEYFTEAIKLYENYSVLDVYKKPSNPSIFLLYELLCYRGAAYIELERYDLGVEDYTRAINYAKGYNLMELAAKYKPIILADIYGQGENNFMNEVRKKPETFIVDDFSKFSGVEAYAGRGKAYFLKQNFDNAIVDCTEAIELNTSDWLVYYSRANAYFARQRYTDALKDYAAILKNDVFVDKSKIYADIGECYLQLGENDLAIQNCTKAISLNPKNFNAYRIRGWSYFYKKDYDQAIRDANEVLKDPGKFTIDLINKTAKLTPNSMDAYFLRGFASLEKRNYDLAVEDLTMVIEGRMENPPAHYLAAAYK